MAAMSTGLFSAGVPHLLGILRWPVYMTTMGKFMQIVGTLLGSVAGILACSLLAFVLFVEARFLAGIPRAFATAGVVFWGLISIVGFRLRSAGKNKQLEADATRYKQVLDSLVQRNRGRVTVRELATALAIDLAQAKEYLDMLVKAGEASPELSDQLTQYYQVGPVTADPLMYAPPPPPPPPPPMAAPLPPRPQTRTGTPGQLES